MAGLVLARLRLLVAPLLLTLNPTAGPLLASCGCQVHLGDTPHNLSEVDFEALARQTDGFSGSDISVCVSGDFTGGNGGWFRPAWLLL